jgi:hypothetical protein
VAQAVIAVVRYPHSAKWRQPQLKPQGATRHEEEDDGYQQSISPKAHSRGGVEVPWRRARGGLQTIIAVRAAAGRPGDTAGLAVSAFGM